MSFQNYKEVRPWAKAIKQQVATHSMPPWDADPKVDKFSNDRSLTDAASRDPGEVGRFRRARR